MTAPEPHGYPDWGRFVASGDKLYIFENETNGANVENRGPFFVGDVPSLAINHVYTGSAGRVSFNFWADAALTQSVQGSDFDFGVQGSMEVVIPVMGPWLTVQIVTNVPPAQWLLKIASNIGRRASFGNSAGRNVIMSQVGTAVAAGATSTIDIGVIVPGPALLNIDTSLATWLATLSERDSSATIVRMDTITHLHAKAPRPCYMSGITPRFTFQNTTGAPGAYTASLVVYPAWPGS